MSREGSLSGRKRFRNPSRSTSVDRQSPAAGSEAHTPKKRRKSKSPYALKPKRHVCPHCDRSFAQTGDLKRHVRTHTGEKPFACDICGRTFRRRAHVRDHMITHTGAKKHSCDKCDKRFTRPTALTIHMRSHTGERPFRCDVCHKDFAQRSHLTRHKRTRQCLSVAEEQTESASASESSPDDSPPPPPRQKLRRRSVTASPSSTKISSSLPTSSNRNLRSSRPVKTTPVSSSHHPDSESSADNEPHKIGGYSEAPSLDLHNPPVSASSRPAARSNISPSLRWPSSTAPSHSDEGFLPVAQLKEPRIPLSVNSSNWSNQGTQSFPLSQAGISSTMGSNQSSGFSSVSSSPPNGATHSQASLPGSQQAFFGRISQQNSAPAYSQPWSRSHPLATGPAPSRFETGNMPLLGSRATSSQQRSLHRRSSLDWSTADAPPHRLQPQTAATMATSRRLPKDITIPPGDISATAPPAMVSPTASYYYPNPDDPIVPSSSSPVAQESTSSASTSRPSSQPIPVHENSSADYRTSTMSNQDRISAVLAAAHLLDFSAQPRTFGNKLTDISRKLDSHPLLEPNEAGTSPTQRLYPGDARASGSTPLMTSSVSVSSTASALPSPPKHHESSSSEHRFTELSQPLSFSIPASALSTTSSTSPAAPGTSEQFATFSTPLSPVEPGQPPPADGSHPATTVTAPPQSVADPTAHNAASTPLAPNYSLAPPSSMPAAQGLEPRSAPVQPLPPTAAHPLEPLTSPSLPPTIPSSVIILANSTGSPAPMIPPEAEPGSSEPSTTLQNSNLIESFAFPGQHPPSPRGQAALYPHPFSEPPAQPG